MGMKLRPLSKAARDARRPLPPEELIDAHQDRIHRDVGRGRAVRLPERRPTNPSRISRRSSQPPLHPGTKPLTRAERDAWQRGEFVCGTQNPHDKFDRLEATVRLAVAALVEIARYDDSSTEAEIARRALRELGED